MCFFGFLRSGEITVLSLAQYDQEVHLSEGDVRLNRAVPPKVIYTGTDQGVHLQEGGDNTPGEDRQ